MSYLETELYSVSVGKIISSSRHGKQDRKTTKLLMFRHETYTCSSQNINVLHAKLAKAKVKYSGCDGLKRLKKQEWTNMLKFSY